MPLSEEQKKALDRMSAQQRGMPQARNLSMSQIDQLSSSRRIEREALANPPSFLKGMAQDFLKPFAEVGTSALNLGESAVDLARGDVQGAGEALQKTRNVPFVGETKPAFTGQESFGEAAKKVGGYGAETASSLFGGGGAVAVGKAGLKGLVRQGLQQGVKYGTVTGAMGLGGRAAQEDESIGGVLMASLMGGAGGAALGGAFGAAAPALKNQISKMLAPVENKISKVLRESIEKGIKPYFGNKVTPVARDAYMKKAEQGFISIFKHRPEVFDEKIGAKVEKLPTNRKEMLEALTETKKTLYSKYHSMAQEAGEEGAAFSTDKITSKLSGLTEDLKLSPASRKYATKLIDEIGELQNQAPEIIEERIKDLNSSLAGYFEGRVNKAKAQLDASVAAMMREELDAIITKASGQGYGALKREYGALRTIEKDLVRQVSLEARKGTKGLLDFTDIFTGSDIISGLITMNPASVARGVGGRGLKEFYKYLNDPNRYIKKGFSALDNPDGKVTKMIQALIQKSKDVVSEQKGVDLGKEALE